MADFRKDCYSGSLTLVKECGPVRVNVWPGDKEVDVLLEDPDSEYTITGGGGSAEYVIPEQTATITSDPASINIENFSELQPGDKLVMKMIVSGYTTSFNYWSMFVTFDENLTGEFIYNETLAFVDIVPSGDTADLYVYDGDDNMIPGTYTITVIKAPF